MSETIIKEYKESGWVFDYDPMTKFIGGKHSMGGRMSICEVPKSTRDIGDEFGQAIADLMNSEIQYKAPIPELEGALPLVVYFGNEQDREGFIKTFQEVMPNATTVKL